MKLEIIQILGFRFWCLALAQSDDMRLPPWFIRTPNETVYKQDDSIMLQCVARGIPPPEYIWLKDGKKINTDSNIIINKGTLVIPHAINFRDEGKYQCKAENKYGVALSKNTTVKQSYIKFESNTEVQEKVFKKYEPATLHPHGTIEGFPQPTFSWKTVKNAVTNKEPREIETSSRITTDATTGTLYFANILDEDSNDGMIYKLDVRNNMIDEQKGGSPYKITVIDQPGKRMKPVSLAPRFNVSHFEYVGIKGKNITLMCFFGGYPTPYVNWWLPHNYDAARVDCWKEFASRCYINNLKYTDEGEYTCIGNNNEGRTEVRIALKVESIPSFKVKPKNQNVIEGQTAILRCEADAKPEATVEWFSNGQLLNATDAGNSGIIIRGKELQVKNVCRDCNGTASDLQVFQCRISNKHGEDLVSAYLNVVDAYPTTTQKSPSELITNLVLAVLAATFFVNLVGLAIAPCCKRTSGAPARRVNHDYESIRHSSIQCDGEPERLDGPAMSPDGYLEPLSLQAMRVQARPLPSPQEMPPAIGCIHAKEEGATDNDYLPMISEVTL